jgi:uncharacterized beta-barrel protein YwiB (DUF1934 family)
MFKIILTVNSIIDNLADNGLPDGEPEINIFTTEGTLRFFDGDYIMTFKEECEGQSITSHITVNESFVRLIKNGAIESDMLFEEGKTFSTLYRVGPYSFNMDITTKKIRSTLSENGGELQLIYSMNIGGQEKNARMKISAKRK